MSFVRPALAALLLPSVALSQQFVYQDLLPGPDEWSEGVEAADVDQDGDFDLFFANGEGLYTPGVKLQNVLVMNRLEQAPDTFVDESLTRLGPNVSNAKQVVTADVDADGWLDALYCNAFSTDPPFLYVNRGAAQPGFFDEDGSARGLTGLFSSAGASFGDVDDDGDLDLVLGDTGPSFTGSPGGTPHLFLNDGAGSFTDATPALNAPLKEGHLDIDLVDIDLDWDLDVFGTNRGSSANGIHYLLLNDGSGQFSDASSTIPNTSGNVYEADAADLDGDTDIDLFFLSLFSFEDGPMRNDTTEDGTLGFSKGFPLGGDDDNEVSFIDHDMDGDLDVVIGSLGPTEKLVRNDGDGTFVQVTDVITNLADRTLDVAVVDLDLDGRYDLVTAQGESSPSTWRNKVFVNSGPVDDAPPTIQRVEALAELDPTGPWVVHAQVLDQVHDDGKNWVTGAVTYRVDVGIESGTPTSGEVLQSAGSIYRFEMADTAAGAGTRLVYELTFTDVAGNQSTTGEVVVPIGPCGFTTYGNSTPAHLMLLSGGGTGALGTIIDVTTSQTGPGPVLTGLSLARAELPFAGGLLLVDPAQLVTLEILPVVGVDATWFLTVPDNPALLGQRFDFQSIAPDDGLPGGFRFSGGLELVVCN